MGPPATELDLARRLGANVRALREARGLTQGQMAKLAELPRATWANLETGTANPTLAVLHRVAVTLQVSIEELTNEPSAAARLFRRGELAERTRGGVVVRSLLPHKVPNMVLERLELGARARLVGTPHMAGTREYFTCERGSITLVASAERFHLSEGDVVVFRGDQKHSYENRDSGTAVGYSIVVLRPPT
jgi:XRE family transcriptional regulator, regulator of sulfur utilization